jgi:hypothetical protein
MCALVAVPVFAQAPQITVNPQVKCFVAGQVPQLQASIAPSAGVEARLVFRSKVSAEYYQVKAQSTPGGFVVRLPKPTEAAVEISYYWEYLKPEPGSRSPEITGRVVAKKEDCKADEPLALLPTGGAMPILTLAGAPVTGAALGAAAGTPWLLIGGAAAGVGITGGVIAGTTGGEASAKK